MCDVFVNLHTDSMEENISKTIRGVGETIRRETKREYYNRYTKTLIWLRKIDLRDQRVCRNGWVLASFVCFYSPKNEPQESTREEQSVG